MNHGADFPNFREWHSVSARLNNLLILDIWNDNKLWKQKVNSYYYEYTALI